MPRKALPQNCNECEDWDEPRMRLQGEVSYSNGNSLFAVSNRYEGDNDIID